MADTKITGLSALTGTGIATGDQFVMVDVSDTTMDATGTNKKMSASELAIAVATVKPPSRSLSDTHTDTTVVNSTTETTLASQAVPATVATGDIVRMVAVGDLLNNSGSTNTFTFKVILGATTAITSNAVSVASSTNRQPWRITVDLLVVATNDERISVEFIGSNGAGWSVGTSGRTGSGRGTATEDLTAGKNLQLSATLSAASANMDCVAHESFLEVVKR